MSLIIGVQDDSNGTILKVMHVFRIVVFTYSTDPRKTAIVDTVWPDLSIKFLDELLFKIFFTTLRILNVLEILFCNNLMCVPFKVGLYDNV